MAENHRKDILMRKAFSFLGRFPKVELGAFKVINFLRN